MERSTDVSGARTPSDAAERPWLAAWAGLPLLGIANGVIRERAYADRLGDETAHQVSTATLIVGIAGYAWALDRRWPLGRAAGAVTVGGVWAALTVTFEFVFGHFVAGESWRDLVRDYDVRRRRLWVLVPITTAFAPAAARAVGARHRRGRAGSMMRRTNTNLARSRSGARSAVSTWSSG
jgi:hypothetical protein